MNPHEIVNAMFSNDPFSKWLGIEVMKVEEGSCRLQMKIRNEMLNGFALAHGAITYALADSALAFAANSYGKKSLSVDTSINHIESLKEGDVIVAEAFCESLKNKFALFRVEIKREDVVVAIFRGTVYRSEKEW
jgi:acyl-CoA thioesterase